jgi:hypothetical protein
MESGRVKASSSLTLWIALHPAFASDDSSRDLARTTSPHRLRRLADFGGNTTSPFHPAPQRIGNICQVTLDYRTSTRIIQDTTRGLAGANIWLRDRTAIGDAAGHPGKSNRPKVQWFTEIIWYNVVWHEERYAEVVMLIRSAERRQA